MSLQEHFPDRALDSPRPKHGSSSAQLQEEECSRMFDPSASLSLHSTLQPSPGNGGFQTHAKPRPKLLMKGVFTGSGHLMARWISCPSHSAGDMSLVFTETNFQWANGTQTGVW